MTTRTELTTVERVHEERSWLFTTIDRYGEFEEVVLVPCDDGVEAYVNRCTHEAQKLDRGFGAAVRNGQVVCPKHGSMFDTCSGYCDNGDAAETTLVSVEVTTDGGSVFLAAADYEFSHEGGVDDAPDDGDDGDDDEDDDLPSSTSHIGF